MRRALALTELVIVLALFALLFALALPVIQDHRRHASIKADLSKLRMIAMASAMYSDASQDRLFTFSWKPGQVPVTPNTQLALANANLNTNSGADELRAAVLQQLDILTHAYKDERLPPDPALAPTGHAPHINYNHLVLNKFLNASLPNDLFISAADKHRTYWKNNLDEYLDNPIASPVRPPTGESSFLQLWRWPFSSSFQVGVSHYSNDTGNVGNPPTPRTAQRITNHRAWSMPTEPGVLANRTMNEVAFPAQKVTLFDEFDRYNANGPQYFAIEKGSNLVNFYDGHAERKPIAEANFGFWPNDPERGSTTPDQPSFFYGYNPITWWDPPGAVSRSVPAYYDQTRGGLQGIDFD